MNKRKAHYVRVSTLEQNSARQKSIILGAMVYEDKCSGIVPFKERTAGGRLIEDIEAGNISEVNVHSIDRLGRDTLDIMQTIQYMTSKRVNVISTKEGLNTLNADGSENMIAKMIIGILGTLSEFEYERIKERQREGIAIAKERGNYKANGRPEGTKESVFKFLEKPKAKKVIKYLEQKRSIRETAKLAECSVGFVQKVKGYINA